jgi:hypothetical protein
VVGCKLRLENRKTRYQPRKCWTDDFSGNVAFLIDILLTALCSWLIHYSEIANVYLITNIIIAITWAFVFSYFFGIWAELDKAGKLAAIGSSLTLRSCLSHVRNRCYKTSKIIRQNLDSLNAVLLLN